MTEIPWFWALIALVVGVQVGWNLAWRLSEAAEVPLFTTRVVLRETNFYRSAYVVERFEPRSWGRRPGWRVVSPGLRHRYMAQQHAAALEASEPPRLATGSNAI